MKGYKLISEDIEAYDTEKEAEICISANMHKPDWVVIEEKLYSKDW